MPDYDIKHYDLTDMERQGLPFTKFDKRVYTQYKKEENPTVKPETVFEGFKKVIKKGKKSSK